MRKIWRVKGFQLVASLGVTVATMLATPASATLKYGPLQLSGNFETQEMVRNSEIDKLMFIMNRNTVRLRVDYDWLDRGRFLDKFDVPFIERSKLFLFYRGVYDGFYGIAPGGRQQGQTRYDDLVGGTIGQYDASQRFNLGTENELREAYIDLKLADLPLSFRMGKQQVIWGESDNNRVMDIISPIDVTWHLQQESWDQLRIPEWMIKGLYDIGELGPLSNTYFEFLWNPGDYHPGAKVAFLPRPWSASYSNPIRNGQVQRAFLNPNLPVPFYLSPSFNLNATSFRQGDFSRGPGSTSEVGARLHGVTPFGLEFTINYFYGRGKNLATTNPYGVKINKVILPVSTSGGFASPIGRFQLGSSSVPVLPTTVDAEVIHPYTHFFGTTGNYFEGDYTQTVFRWETVYAMAQPFSTGEEDKRPFAYYSDGVTSTGERAGFGYTRRDTWIGMIGFDRPTWIRFLNRRNTVFFTGQFFWNYTFGNVNNIYGQTGAGDNPYFTPPSGPGSTTHGVGSWSTGPYKGRTDRLQDGGFVGNGDNIRRWEHLVTLAANTNYRGGTLVPQIVDAWDPVNGNNEVILSLEWFVTNDLIVQILERFFFTYASSLPSNDPWGAAGRNARRDETSLRITYQF